MAERRDQRVKVARVCRQVVEPIGRRRAVAEAAQVRHDHLEARARERLDVAGPDALGLGPAVREQQRRPSDAFPPVGDLDVRSKTGAVHLHGGRVYAGEPAGTVQRRLARRSLLPPLVRQLRDPLGLGAAAQSRRSRDPDAAHEGGRQGRQVGLPLLRRRLRAARLRQGRARSSRSRATRTRRSRAAGCARRAPARWATSPRRCERRRSSTAGPTAPSGRTSTSTPRWT